MSRTVLKPVPKPAKAAPCRMANGTNQLKTLSVGNDGRSCRPVNEPENAITKNIGITTSGMTAAGIRRMPTMLRLARLTATGTHEVFRTLSAATAVMTTPPDAATRARCAPKIARAASTAATPMEMAASLQSKPTTTW